MLSDSEIAGFLIKSPVRGAIAIVLLDGPLPEDVIAMNVAGQLAKVTWASVAASSEDVHRELAQLSAAEIIEPVAKADTLLYRIAESFHKAVDAAMAPLPAPEEKPKW